MPDHNYRPTLHPLNPNLCGACAYLRCTRHHDFRCVLTKDEFGNDIRLALWNDGIPSRRAPERCAECYDSFGRDGDL